MIDTHWWRSQRGPGPVIATAIHDGTALRREVANAMKLSDSERFREEDPFTGQAIEGVPTNLIVNRSRFEIDINRARDSAVYLTPEMAWGLDIWKRELPQPLVRRSKSIHEAYYTNLAGLLDQVCTAHPKFCLLDVHSYNHRRDGPDAAPTPQAEAPDINIGTFSMPEEEWSWLLDPLLEEIASFDFDGKKLDVRKNVAFQGRGEQTRFVHDRYPRRGCAIAFEFKKIYMDEWSGRPIPSKLAAMRGLIDHVASKAMELLDGAK